MVTGAMDSQAVVEYMEQRLLVLKATNPPFRRKHFSVEAPHTCEHCKDEAIRIDIRSTTTRCFDCLWVGVGKAAADPLYIVCGGCNKLLANSDLVVYLASLTHSPSEAIVASQSGCALYELLVDSLILAESNSTDGWTKAKSRFSVDSSRFTLYSQSFVSDPQAICSLQMRVGRVGNTSGIALAELDIWTTASSKASRLISSRPYEQDVTSKSSIKFSRQCLKSCLETHYRCRGRLTLDSDRQARRPGYAMVQESSKTEDIPSRLLHIAPAIGPNRVRLIEVRHLTDEEKHEISKAGFAALSYCWGGDQVGKLMTTNYTRLRNGFDTLETMKTIQDAVWVAREIGLEYLWVDSLCILQDDAQDKEREIARMGKYYGGATVTICAASASTASEGFLHRRATPSYAAGPIRLPLRNKDGESEGDVLLLQEDLDLTEPTTTRGWTMQESLLSRRILAFTQRQIYWCCVNSYAGCGGKIVDLADRVTGGQESLVGNIHPMGSMMDRNTLSRWILLLEQYTRRQLGFEGDKLLAFSAVAADTADACKARGEDVIYLAGLLVEHHDQHSWLHQLLWFSYPTPAHSTRPKAYRAPSWSWAAVDGSIGIGSNRVTETAAHVEMTASVEDHFIDLLDPNAPFGSVLGGYLTLWAKKIPVSNCINSSLPTQVMLDWTVVEKELHSTARIEFFPDAREDIQTLRDEVSDQQSPSRPSLSLICLYEEPTTASSSRLGIVAVGLIVSTGPGTEVQTFTRIGLFRIRGGMDTLGHEVNNEASEIFRPVEKQCLRIV
ncbi:heterokaryon incompatibility protein-domain-containing protein [Dactylonectria macrodidyma]|uniref:Heterokaryon incompatibility protein-domain-containing protein n=1 Tax=Dactylonectria macrodidyma TaxID=307937 RepID=A0A9P9IMN7_9HYPO|nr:heterokaryon incompatibility protein-domain-containing protein [Dactylonectria macrodidyma]